MSIRVTHASITDRKTSIEEITQGALLPKQGHGLGLSLSPLLSLAVRAVEESGVTYCHPPKQGHLQHESCKQVQRETETANMHAGAAGWPLQTAAL